MLSIKDFKGCKISANTVWGGEEGTSGTMQFSTTGGGGDCTTREYLDDCNRTEFTTVNEWTVPSNCAVQ